MRHYRPAFRTMFPYCFKLAKKSGYVLVAFNRDYEYIPRGTIRFMRKPNTFKGIWSAIYKDSLYMYNDDPDSRTDYFRRLDKLLLHKHEVVKDNTVNIKSINDIHYKMVELDKE